MHVNTWSPVGGTTEGLGGAAVLEDVCCWVVSFEASCYSQCVPPPAYLETEPSAAAPATSYLLSTIMNSDPLKL